MEIIVFSIPALITYYFAVHVMKLPDYLAAFASSGGVPPPGFEIQLAGTLGVFALSMYVWWSIYRRLMRYTFDPQLGDRIRNPYHRERLTELARSRKGGLFRPDFRHEGWNQSRYAPKNKKGRIGEEATQLANLTLLAVLGAGYLNGRLVALETWLWAFALASLVLVIFGAQARRRAWRQVRDILLETYWDTDYVPSERKIAPPILQ